MRCFPGLGAVYFLVKHKSKKRLKDLRLNIKRVLSGKGPG